MSARVLITRAEDDALETAQNVEALGYDTLIDSILRIRPETWEEPDWNTVSALIVTSHNALRGFEGHGVPRDKLFFLVGARTARDLRKRGFIHVTATVEKSDDLPYPIRMQRTPVDGTLLHLTSEHAHTEFYEALNKEGFRIETRRVYHAEEAKELQPATLQALKDGKVTAALFYSARTVMIFEGLIKRHNMSAALKNLTALCLSRAVAEACDKSLWKRVEVAEAPTHERLMECLAKAVPLNP
jgi:uroporphyrinogen-III synthase